MYSLLMNALISLRLHALCCSSRLLSSALSPAGVGRCGGSAKSSVTSFVALLAYSFRYWPCFSQCEEKESREVRKPPNRINQKPSLQLATVVGKSTASIPHTGTLAMWQMDHFYERLNRHVCVGFQLKRQEKSYNSTCTMQNMVLSYTRASVGHGRVWQSPYHTLAQDQKCKSKLQNKTKTKIIPILIQIQRL